MLPQIKVTPELSAILREIDRIKATLSNRSTPPAVLAKLEREFIEDAVYHSGTLDAHMRTLGYR